MRKEFRKRLASEYRYALTKMQEVKQPARKLFYFSVFFSEAQRLINLEWDNNLALVQIVTQHVHTQINGTMQNPMAGALPIDWDKVYNKLSLVASDLTTYFEKEKDTHGELCDILARFAEIYYAVTGHGSYLHEKGTFNY